MPIHLQMECGFQGNQELSSLGTSTSSDKAVAVSEKRRQQQDAEMETKRIKAEIMSSLAMFNSFYKERQQSTTQTAVAYDKNTVLDKVVQCNLALNDTDTINSMSPRTREQYVASVTKRRRRLVAEMVNLEEEGANSS